MRNYVYVVLFFVSFAYTNCSYLYAQDYHLSQYEASPLYLNPAATGIFGFDFLEYDVRFGVNYRQQWRSIRSQYVDIPTPFTTYSFFGDYKFRTPKQLVGLGVLLYQDKSGDLGLTTQQVNLSIAVHQYLNTKNTTSIGLGIAVGNAARTIDFSNATYDAQWTGVAFDPSLPTNELFPQTRFSYSDISGGLHFHRIPAQGLRLNVGFSVFHLNRPAQNFIRTDTSRLANKIVAYWQSQYEYTPKRELLTYGHYYNQGSYHEGLLMAYHQWTQQVNKSQKIAYAVGGGGRLVSKFSEWVASDAVVVGAKLKWEQFETGITYDVNISSLTRATNLLGGIELSLIYHEKTNKSTRRRRIGKRAVCPDPSINNLPTYTE